MGLIKKWVDVRIVQLRLTEEETKELREKLAAMRQKGEEALKRYQTAEVGDDLRELYKDWERCPICSGASPMGGVK
jgi:hypothetical protein